MRSVNWANVAKSAKQTKKNVKNMQGSVLFFQHFPEEGHMTDVVDAYTILEDGTKKKAGKTTKDIVIAEARSSTLRRLVKALDNYYYLITDNQSKQRILDKKVELENELNSREDGIKE